MKKQISYEDELKCICQKIQKSFSIKINTISALQTNHYLKRLIKLNKKTNNQNIDELITVIGRTNLAYKKYCKENNYYTDPYVNKKITQAYSKLSKKSMKMKTKKSNIKNNGLDFKIEYNSDKGLYEIAYLKNGQQVKSKEYKVKNIKNLDSKRKMVLDRLKKLNYGISIFKELGIEKDKFYKVNPDIIHILLNEGKLDYAKMYIKEVVGREPLHKPFEIKYVLNRNVKQGVFSAEENKAMKKMAKEDRLATNLVIFSSKKKKEIAKPQIMESKRNRVHKLDKINNIKISLKIQEIKKKKENRIIAEKLEQEERRRKIQSINEKRKLKLNSESDNKIGKISELGCKIYNIDRRNIQINNTNEFGIQDSKCRFYNIEKNNRDNSTKSAVHGDR